MQFILYGWPEAVEPRLKPYWSRRLELSVEDGCILWGSRVIIPPPGQKRMLAELHEGHPGMARMKGLAWMHMWWPGMEQEIETTVHNCHECQKHRAVPPQAPLQTWSWPKQPWSRVHMDFAGPLDNRMLLVVVDAYTKWIEVIPMSNATSLSTIQQLRTLFAQFGFPRTVVTDNGTCFTSEEFKSFLTKNGISHVRSTPYHPASNGLAERAVRIVKEGLHKMKEGTLSDRSVRFLIAYRNTPHSTTCASPSELMFGRRIYTRLYLIKPSLEARVEISQLRRKRGHNQHTRDRTFTTKEEVYVRNFGPGEVWLPGIVTQVSGPGSYSVELSDGRSVRRHQYHLRQHCYT